MWRRALGVICAVLASGGRGLSLTDEEIFREFRFNRINPGARALGLGGAFISLSDDATAAQSNPAGLRYLLRPEYFVELRAVDTGGSAAIISTSLPGLFVTTAGTGTNFDDGQNLSFLSAVYPLGRLTLGVSRQEVLNSDASTLNSFSITSPGSPGAFFADGTGFIDVKQTTYNLSGGVRATDRLAFGASVVFGRLEVRSRVENVLVDTNGQVTGGPPILTPETDLVTTIDDDDTAVGFNIGAIYRPFETLSFGAVYRRAPKFSVTERVDPSPAYDDVFNVRTEIGGEFENEFNMPDSYGLGASWRAQARLTLAFDLERIEYSDLLEGYVSGVNVLTEPEADFDVDDATEFRLGAEYVAVARPGFHLALRGGYFTLSDGKIFATSDNIGFAGKEAFPEGGRDLVGAIGVGLGWPSYQVDLAASLGSETKEYLVSFIYRAK